MIKIKFPVVCCFLLLDLCLSGCATTPKQQNTSVEAPKVQKSTTLVGLIKKHNQLPAMRVQVVQRPDRLRVVLYSDVCFQSNGKLIPECSSQLLKAMKVMKQYGDGMIQVVGYTDDIYDAKTATELSQQQAQSVVAFLWTQGINSRRLYAIGGASQNPNATNRSVKGSAANRRVELILVK